jgi:probable HAF family extracellular repeat protein
MFRIIEGPAPPPTYAVLTGVSADSSVVVGCTSSGRAFSWTLANGPQSLSDLPGGELKNCAYGVSADGSVIVGVGTSYPETTEAVRWINGIVEGIGDLQNGLSKSSASAVSHDGAVVVGTAFGQAFRWNNGTMIGLGNLPGGSLSEATGVSANGQAVAGFGRNASGNYEAFRWENGAMVGLGDLAGGGSHSSAYAISADGRVVVGLSEDQGGQYQAFRWEDGVMTGLGPIQVGTVSWAFGVSGDGAIVVGEANGAAFIWDQTSGMRKLQDVLTNDLGLNLGSWTLTQTTAISPDGLTVVGKAGNRGFIARLGYPDTSDTDGDGIPNVVDVCHETIPDIPVDVVGCPASVPGDLDHDGDVDLMDYAILQRCMSGVNALGDPACNTSP